MIIKEECTKLSHMSELKVGMTFTKFFPELSYIVTPGDKPSQLGTIILYNIRVQNSSQLWTVATTFTTLASLFFTKEIIIENGGP